MHSKLLYPNCCLFHFSQNFFIHQNGSLLRKYAYLSNDSSYSVSPEDNVDILLMDNLSSDDDKKTGENRGLTNTPKTSSYLQDDLNVVQSFTFEAQVGITPLKLLVIAHIK